MLDKYTRNILALYAADPSKIRVENDLYGSWIAILTQIFPASEGYHVVPQSKYLGPALIIQVKKGVVFNWEKYDPSELNGQTLTYTNEPFQGETAEKRVYWLQAAGTKWRYGYKDKSMTNIKHLIDWHHVTHDEASFTNLQALKALIQQL